MEILKEGKAKFYAYPGDPTKGMPVFYNPAMGKQRDITVCALAVFQKESDRKLEICDPLAGSGVRGIRLLKEDKGIEKITFNDVSSESIKLIRKNLRLNKITKKTKVVNNDARILLFENKSSFDFIDIDPFGSPIKYLEASAFAIRHRGLFAATATDTGALAGSFPKTCLRRYGVRVCKTDFYKELGVRILITAIQQAFARYAVGFAPLLVHEAHYFRVIGTVQKNRSSSDRTVKQIGFISYCKKCLFRTTEIEKECGDCKAKTELIGPIWLGQIQDNDFVKKVSEEAEKRRFKISFREEIDFPTYYDIAEVCRKNKLGSVKIDKVIGMLRENGFEASRSCLWPTGVKTDAGIRELSRVLK